MASWHQSEAERLIDDLSGLYGDLSRLAQQLGEVAGEAPYPQVADKLRALQSAKAECAEEVHRRLHTLGKRPSIAPVPTSDRRGSSWARLAILVDAERAVLRKLGTLAARWEDEQPDDAQLFRSLSERGRRCRAELADLAARSDPHAID